jgi:hypothetical protein
MNLPGFTAEAALGPRRDMYYTKVMLGGDRGSGVVPQLRFQQGVDLGAYLRCRANGGPELICRFFGGFLFSTGRLARST